MADALPFPSVPAALQDLFRRLFAPTLDRMLRLRGRARCSLSADTRAEIAQETCLCWLQREAGGWRPPAPGRELDLEFLRMVSRSHYRVARATQRQRHELPLAVAESGIEDELDGAPAGRDDPAALAQVTETLRGIGELPFPAARLTDALLAPGRGRAGTRPELARLARAVDQSPRQVRHYLRCLEERAGCDQRWTAFWSRRLGEALWQLAQQRLLSCTATRLLPQRVAADHEPVRQRLMRVLARLRNAPVASAHKPAVSAARALARTRGAGLLDAATALDAAQLLLGACTAIALVRAEVARAGGDLVRAWHAVEDARFRAHTRAERRAAALARARLLEQTGAYARAAAALQADDVRIGPDPVLIYDRLALRALALAPARATELEAELDDLRHLPASARRRCRGFLAEDQGPFAARLRADPGLRRDVLARLG